MRIPTDADYGDMTTDEMYRLVTEQRHRNEAETYR